MITIEELIGETKWEDIPEDHRDNLLILLEKLNKVRAKYGKPMTVTSGYRSTKHHLEIYAKKGITDKSKIPMKSKHLFGQACDIYDPKKELQKWCKDNEKFLNEVGVWLESFEDTPNWVHFQSVPYGSWKEGKSIWFKP
jgi:uncharacterized protein YcbK (DUF882 family)